MKHSNLIAQRTIKTHLAIHRWSLIFSGLLISIILIISFFQMLLFVELSKTKKEYAFYAEMIAKKQHEIDTASKLKTEESILKKQIGKIIKNQEHPKNPLNLLITVINACSSQKKFQKYLLHKKIGELSVISDTTQAALDILQKIQQSPLITHASLHALQQDQQTKKSIATIKMTLK